MCGRQILVDGQPLQKNVPRMYFAVNKPKGYLCASSADPGAVGGKKLVIDLFAVRTFASRQQGFTEGLPACTPQRPRCIGADTLDPITCMEWCMP